MDLAIGAFALAALGEITANPVLSERLQRRVSIDFLHP
jgi:hypothetical protein